MTRLMSLFTIPSKPMENAVVAPMTITNDSAASDSSNRGDILDTMKMPAVTMVAAWISAEIGVGPSIESGSQTCSGSSADLPMAPINRQMQINVIAWTLVFDVSGSIAEAIFGAAAKASA